MPFAPSTQPDKHIADLDDALAAAQVEDETSDLPRSSKTSPPRSVVVFVDVNVVHLSKSITEYGRRLSGSLRLERIQLCKDLIRLYTASTLFLLSFRSPCL